MSKAVLTQKFMEATREFQVPFTFWHQVFLKGANDNAMPWRKRLVLTGIWGLCLALVGVFLQFMWG